MDECRVEWCQRDANLDGLCLFHRRKDIAGELEYADGVIYDLCAKGHRWTPENTHIESNSKGGKRRRCKQCLVDKAERKRNEEPVAEAPAPVALGIPTHRQAFRTADAAEDVIEAKCKGNPGPYIDYDRNNIPTDAEAAKLCADCPLIAACGNKAVAIQADWGVWGGTAFVRGEPWDRDRSKLYDDE